MKVLITTDTYYPSINGVVTSVNTLYHALKERGHEVRILTLSDNLHSKKEGDIYYIRSFNARIYPGARGTVPVERHFCKEIEKWRPDIIHSQTEFFTMMFAKRIAKNLNIPIIHTYHTMYEHYMRYLFKVNTVSKKSAKLFSKELLRSVEGLITPTDKVKRTLKEYGLQQPMFVIPSGLSMDKIQKDFSETERQALRKKLNISEEKKVIVTVGRVGLEKNLDEILNHFFNFHLEHKEVLWLIVGDGPYRQELQEKVAFMNLSEDVIFAGMVAPEDIYRYYKLGDVFVSASVSETQGLTYIEALMAGTPIVCRRDDCLEDIMQNGVNGYYFTEKEEFCEHLEELLYNTELREKFAQAALNSVQKFSKEEFGKQAERAYYEIIRRNSGRKKKRSMGKRIYYKWKKLPKQYIEKMQDYFKVIE